MSTTKNSQVLAMVIENAKRVIKEQEQKQEQKQKREWIIKLNETYSKLEPEYFLLEQYKKFRYLSEEEKKRVIIINNYVVPYKKHRDLLAKEANGILTLEESNDKNKLEGQLRLELVYLAFLEEIESFEPMPSSKNLENPTTLNMELEHYDRSLMNASSGQTQTTAATTCTAVTASEPLATASASSAGSSSQTPAIASSNKDSNDMKKTPATARNNSALASAAGSNDSASKPAAKSASNGKTNDSSVKKKTMDIKKVPKDEQILILSARNPEEREETNEFRDFIANNNGKRWFYINIRERKTERTPLMLAAKKGFYLYIAQLLSSGADSDLKDINHKTALTLAIQELANITKTSKIEENRVQTDYLEVITRLIIHTTNGSNHATAIRKALKDASQDNNEKLVTIINDYVPGAIKKRVRPRNETTENTKEKDSSTHKPSSSGSGSKSVSASASASSASSSSKTTSAPSPASSSGSGSSSSSKPVVNPKSAASSAVAKPTSRPAVVSNSTTKPTVTTDSFAAANPLKRSATQAGLPTPSTCIPLARISMLYDENEITTEKEILSPKATHVLPHVPTFGDSKVGTTSLSSSTIVSEQLAVLKSISATNAMNTSSATNTIISPAASGSGSATATSTTTISATPKPIMFSPASTAFAEQAKRLQELRKKKEAEQNAVKLLQEQQRMKTERNAELAKQKAELEAKQAAEFAKQASECGKLESEFAEKAAERARLEKSVADMDAQNTEIDKQNAEMQAFLNSNATAVSSSSDANADVSTDIGQPSAAKKPKL